MAKNSTSVKVNKELEEKIQLISKLKTLTWCFTRIRLQGLYKDNQLAINLFLDQSLICF